MSETPDFVGQKYTNTTTGDIWNANSTTPGDWSLDLQDALLMWEPRSLKFLEIAALTFSGPFTGITSITMNITSQIGGLEISNGGAGLTSISLPLITAIDPLSLNTGTFKIFANDGMTQLDLPLLANCGWQLLIQSNAIIASISLPSFITCEGGLSISGNTQLVSLSLPVWSPWNGSDNIFVGQKLNASSVNGILARGVANAGFVSGSIVINQGTNAAPSGQGIVDKATLIGRGVTVTTN